jgi:hypothetical protein
LSVNWFWFAKIADCSTLSNSMFIQQQVVVAYLNRKARDTNPYLGLFTIYSPPVEPPRSRLGQSRLPLQGFAEILAIGTADQHRGPKNRQAQPILHKVCLAESTPELPRPK